MNKQQSVQQKISVQKFLSNNKLRPLFSQLTKLLLLKKPSDPIQFLIDYLQKRNKRIILCIQGYDEQKRVKIAKNVSNKFNYKLIELSQLFKGVADYHALQDKDINAKVLAQLDKTQTVYKGIVIAGYPNNIVQADFLQKTCYLPERYFVMDNNQQQIWQAYEKKYEGNIDKMIERNRLELKELEEILGQHADLLPNEVQAATDKIIQTISVKANKKSVPYDSPRIIVLHPPFVVPESSSVLSSSFSLNPISINSTLRKLSNKPAFLSHVESYIRKHNSISKQIELAMLQTMTKSAISKNKGSVILGWPQRKDRLPLLKEHFLNPHLILIFDINKEKSLEKFNSLNQNDGSLFLVQKKPTTQQYSKLYDQYQQMVDELKGKSNVHVFAYDQNTQKVSKTFVHLIENPKIYS